MKVIRCLLYFMCHVMLFPGNMMPQLHSDAKRVHVRIARPAITLK